MMVVWLLFTNLDTVLEVLQWKTYEVKIQRRCYILGFRSSIPCLTQHNLYLSHKAIDFSLTLQSHNNLKKYNNSISWKALINIRTKTKMFRIDWRISMWVKTIILMNIDRESISKDIQIFILVFLGLLKLTLNYVDPLLQEFEHLKDRCSI